MIERFSRPIRMNLQTVNISQIRLDGPGWDDFIFTYPLDGERLQASIREVGVLHPVCLRRDANEFRIVFGARRVLACRRLGWQTVPARVFSAQEPGVEELLQISLEEDLPQRAYNPVEKARVLQRFKGLAGWTIERLCSALAEKLRLPPTQETVEEYLAFCDFAEEIQLAVAIDEVSPAHAFLLKPYRQGERRLLFHQILLPCAPSFSEWRQMLDALEDLKVIQRKSLQAILAGKQLHSILESVSLNPRQKSTALLKAIRRLRYPNLTEYEERFDVTLKDTGLNGSIQIRHAPFFEGDHLDISFRIRSEDDLKKKLTTMRATADRGWFAKLFKIVRGEP